MNIAHRISEAAKLYPEKKSVVFSKRKSDGTYDYPSYTFKEFEERSNQIANRLVSLGITKGTRTLLFVKPCLDFSVITFALFKVGAIPVLIDPGMGMKNLLSSIKQVKPQAMLSIGLVHWVRRLKPSSFRDVKIKISLNRVGGNTHYLYENLDTESRSFTPVTVSASDYSAILFTSGGTGIPKGVLYTHGILNAQTDALKAMFHLNQDQTDIPGFPLFALFTLAMGMTSVIPDMDPTKPAQCDPARIVKNILDHNATFVAGSPSIWERVGKYCEKEKITLPSIKYLVMFGAPVRLEMHQLLKKILPHGDTFTPYGATECLPVSLISGSEVLEKKAPQMLEGHGTCIGKAVPGVKIKIIKTTDIPESQLTELPPGEIGEIAVSGLQVTPAYFDMAEETMKAKIQLNNELWHRMGDLGWMDHDGHLWFMGRKAHRVEALDQTFYSIQVESIFNQHHDIKRTALIKLNRNGKITPALVIERHDKATTMTENFLNDLRKLSQKKDFTKPITNYFLHSGFPVDVRHNIKIDRAKLSVWAQEKG